MRDYLARTRFGFPLIGLPTVLLLVAPGVHATAADRPELHHLLDLVAIPMDLAYTDSLEPNLPAMEPKAPAEVFTERYPNGNVRIQRDVTLDGEGNYVNHGSWKMWGPEGTVVAEGQYDMGKRIGNWTRWIDRNQAPLLQQAPFNRFKSPFLSQATFVNGQMDGEWMITDSDQRKCCQISIKMGKRNGLKITWLSNGKILSQESFKNGVPVGDVLQLNPETGEPKRVATYLQGRRIVTKTTNFRRSKQQQSREMFLAPTRIVKTPDDFWNVRFAQYGEEGESLRHGLSQHWHPNGQLAFSGQYDHDKRVGNFTYWYANGHKASGGAFRNDQLDGPWVWWHENGQKAAIGQYRDGVSIGQWRWWADNGKLTKQRIYDGKHRTEEVADRRMERGLPTLALPEPQ